MDAEHKQDIEPMNIWIKDNRVNLEIGFINTFPPEEHPLDDDMPDFFDNYPDEFRAHCINQYNKLGV